ncbi:threonylcarbamoyl-AMP synthase [Rothia nasimurium]|uniref:L-threonylcarbamoyladenylate synthase n=1 Tax=Rothia nasimurium TaxID=85336 RepID=A0A4Y9F805_9MICC|nr:threonylcarbamoyl-AMP synthase [Rothia nasimurium]TFU23532.1 threonylcarbamoyl-AMP synthase [Rothia nasimurium]
MSVKATIVSATDPETLGDAIATANSAIGAAKTIVIPTDTVYGIATDAFSIEGVGNLLAAKGRTRQMPPPVLIYDQSVLPGLADEISEDARALATEFWPGALTLIFYSQPSLNWDLGETQGTVALRVPNDPVAIELLKNLGPLAVSSANKTGRSAATTAQEAIAQLGDDVAVIFDGGPRPENRPEGFETKDALPSTIVDCTSDRLVVVREGAISVERLREVVPGVLTRAEFEAQEKARREAESALVASSEVMEDTEFSPRQVDEFETEEVEATPRQAAVPVAGSLAAGLVGGTSGTAAVDQRRTASAHAPETRVVQDNTKPYSVADARSLVFGAQKEAPAEPLTEADGEGKEGTPTV